MVFIPPKPSMWYPGIRPSMWYPGIRRGHPLATGLVAAWRLDQSIYARDLIGSYDLTPYNNPTIVGTEFGRAMLFDDAASQYFMCARPVALAAPLSVTAWVYADAVASYPVVVSIAHSGSNNNYFTLGRGFDGVWRVTLEICSSSAIAAARTTALVASDVWQHYAGVCGSPTSHAAFLNGANKAISTTSVTPVGVDRTGIGARVGSAIAKCWSGLIALPKIWNRALTDAEVAWDYQEPWWLITPRLRTYYYAQAPAGGNRRRRLIICGRAA